MIKTPPPSKEFLDNYDAIFRKKVEPQYVVGVFPPEFIKVGGDPCAQIIVNNPAPAANEENSK